MQTQTRQKRTPSKTNNHTEPAVNQHVLSCTTSKPHTHTHRTSRNRSPQTSRFRRPLTRRGRRKNGRFQRNRMAPPAKSQKENFSSLNRRKTPARCHRSNQRRNLNFTKAENSSALMILKIQFFKSCELVCFTEFC